MLPEIQNDGSKSCSNDNYDECMYNALRKRMLNITANENGCTTPWLINVTNICKKSTNIENTCWIAYNRVTNQMNDCTVPCHTIGQFICSTLLSFAQLCSALLSFAQFCITEHC